MPYLSSRIKSQVPFIYFFMASDMSLRCMGYIHTSGFSEQISLSVEKMVKNESWNHKFWNSCMLLTLHAVRADWMNWGPTANICRVVVEDFAEACYLFYVKNFKFGDCTISFSRGSSLESARRVPERCVSWSGGNEGKDTNKLLLMAIMHI